MNDDELITILRGALAAESPRVTADALSAFRWLRVDDELAELTFDSVNLPALAGMRGGGQQPRQVRYQFEDLVIDCEVAEDALLGQLTPAEPATVEVCSPRGAGRPLDLDEEGRFMTDPPPAGPISLRCSRAGRRTVVTPWLLV